MRLRLSEWALIVFFSYIAIVSLLFPLGLTRKCFAFGIAIGVSLAVAGLAVGERVRGGQALSMARDWMPIALTLAAYREMNWFATAHGTHMLERAWIVWDRWLLHERGIQALLESGGWLGPGFLELCYLLVYAVGPFAVGILYGYHRRDLVDHVLVTYLVRDIAGVRAISLFSVGPATQRVRRDGPAAHYDAASPTESSDRRRVWDSFERIPERARVLGIFRGVGTAGVLPVRSGGWDGAC